MRYDWYYPGDAYQAGVTAVFSNVELSTFGALIEAQRTGEAGDVFDVVFRGIGTTEEEHVDSVEYRESRQALENLLQLANIGLRVLQHVPAALVKAERYHDEYDRPGEWLDADGSWKDWESEVEGASCEAQIDALTEIASLLCTGHPENSKGVAA
jgi:hypothetical protein